MPSVGKHPQLFYIGHAYRNSLHTATPHCSSAQKQRAAQQHACMTRVARVVAQHSANHLSNIGTITSARMVLSELKKDYYRVGSTDFYHCSTVLVLVLVQLYYHKDSRSRTTGISSGPVLLMVDGSSTYTSTTTSTTGSTTIPPDDTLYIRAPAQNLN
jgi:hypothetical protein